MREDLFNLYMQAYAYGFSAKAGSSGAAAMHGTYGPDIGERAIIIALAAHDSAEVRMPRTWAELETELALFSARPG